MKAQDTTYKRRWWTLAVVSVALLSISLANTILNVALPTIGRELDASSSDLQWIVDSYTLVFAGLLLTMGSLGDRFGRARALAVGLVIFAAGSLWSALTGSADELIMSRALMGIGGALIMPATLSILTNVFPAGERAKAIGIWSAVAGLGVGLGPATGGWLIENVGWNWVFLVNIPVALGALVAMPKFVPESRDPKQPKLDPLGALLSTAALGLLVWAAIEAPEKGWTSEPVLAGFGAAAVLMAAFVTWELRGSHPMLDVRLFRIRRFTGASVAIGLVFFALMGSVFFLTQYLQDVMDYGAFQAGLGVVPVGVGLVLGSTIGARLAARFGTRNVVAAGLTIVAGGMLMMSGANETSGYGLVGVSLLMLGSGMGVTMGPATESIMSSVPRDNAGIGSAMNDTVRELGGTLGVAILGSLLSGSYGAGMEGHTSDLPAGAAHAAEDSVGGASGVAEKVGGAAGSALDAAAERAFAGAMSSTLVVAAGLALAGAAFAALVLPGRERERSEKAATGAIPEAAPA